MKKLHTWKLFIAAACLGFYVVVAPEISAAEPEIGLAQMAAIEQEIQVPEEQFLLFGPFGIHTPYARDIVDWQGKVTEKPYEILRYNQSGSLAPNTLTVSGAFWGTWMYEESNTPGKFPILSRFPSQHGSLDTSADRWILNNAAVTLTGRVGEWVSVFAQGEYSDIEFIGQDQYQVRKALVMVGNLDKCPVYAYFGRNTVDFGSMDGYNPFTHTVNNHSFRVDSDDPVLAVGYAPHYFEGLNVVATAIPGGRHLRVADSRGSGQFDNWAVNASYRRAITEKLSVEVGGGWINSTIYNSSIPHHPGHGFAEAIAQSPELVENGAWDFYAEVQAGPFTIGGEITATEDDWPATAHKVRAITGQAAYDFEILGKPSRLSFVYGVNHLGPDDTEFEQLKQIAVGLETRITENISLGIEYVRNSAFVPLIAIAQVSDADVRTDSLVIGAKITF